jgi:hypothetical protein
MANLDTDEIDLKIDEHNKGLTSASELVRESLDKLVPLINNMIEKAFSKVCEKIEEKLDPIMNIREELFSCLEKQRLETKYALDSIEQYSRRENIKINGVKEDEGEDLIKKITKIAEDIDVQINYADISTIHRMGKRSQGKPRPVICRFVARHKKEELIKNRKKLKDFPEYKGVVYINDDLTPLRYKIMSYAKSLPNVKQTNAHNGKIYCTKTDGAWWSWNHLMTSSNWVSTMWITTGSVWQDQVLQRHRTDPRDRVLTTNLLPYTHVLLNRMLTTLFMIICILQPRISISLF